DEYGDFIVEGDEVKKWVAMTDFNNEDAVKRLQRIFRAMGLDEGLRRAGAKDGDIVILYDIELEYMS
ncbi:MAG: Obg family GTPase CgtA, partial [Bacillota bacterium]|nr:Obg family GTPase CgtA [Bacillota bacterium]